MVDKVSADSFSIANQFTISGWYGQWNAGDDAILESFIENVVDRFQASVIVLSERPQNIIGKENTIKAIFHPEISLRGVANAFFKGDLLNLIKTLRQSKLFVLGGGGLLRDNTSWRNLIRILDEIWISKLLGKKVMLYAIGVGPFKTTMGKALIGYTVGLCDLITVRDPQSAKLLIQIGIKPERVHVVSDPAFLLPETKPFDNNLTQDLADRQLVGIFPTWGVCANGDFSQAIKIARVLDYFHEKNALCFMAFPMRVRDGEMDDAKFSAIIQSQMKYPAALKIYNKRLSPSELKWVAGKMLFNITVRLHAMIFSLGAGVPVVAINYEPKVANVFSAFDCPQYLVEMDDEFENSLKSSIACCLNNLSTYRDKIKEVVTEVEKRAMHTFDLMDTLNFPR